MTKNNDRYSKYLKNNEIIESVNNYIEENKINLINLKINDILSNISNQFNNEKKFKDIHCIVYYQKLRFVKSIQDNKFFTLETHVNMGNEKNKISINKVIIERKKEMLNELEELSKRFNFSFKENFLITYNINRNSFDITINYKDYFIYNYDFNRNELNKLNNVPPMGGHIELTENTKKFEKSILEQFTLIKEIKENYPEEIEKLLLYEKKLSNEFIENINLINDIKGEKLNDSIIFLNIDNILSKELKNNKKIKSKAKI